MKILIANHSTNSNTAMIISQWDDQPIMAAYHDTLSWQPYKIEHFHTQLIPSNSFWLALRANDFDIDP